MLETDTGLIFYPGGLVEPFAYAPVLSQIAEEGYLVVITPMPLTWPFSTVERRGL